MVGAVRQQQNMRGISNVTRRRPGGRVVSLGLLLLAPALLAARGSGNAKASSPSSLPDVDIVATPTLLVPDAPRDPLYAADVPPELQAVVREALRTPSLRGSRLSIYAARVSDGAPLITLNPDEPLNPASCVKLFTTSTALRVFKPHHRFATEYMMRGTLEGSTLRGDLHVRGMGDPTINQERLYHVATELAARGLTTVTGDLILDDTYFDRITEPPGWEQETQADRSYAAPNGALSLTQNSIGIYVRPGDHRGAPGVVTVEPASDMVTVESQVMTVRFGRRIWVRTVADGDRTKVLVQGVIGMHEPAEKFVRRVNNPAMHFGGSFAQMLKLKGITLKGRVRLGVTPESAKSLFLDQSPAMREIITQLNHHSSNFVAEMLLKDLGAQVYGAPGTTQKGLAAVAATLDRDVGIAPGSYIMGNGSGLNDINRFTTVQLVKLIRKMTLDPTVSPEFLSSLAVAGAGGTLSHRMNQSAAEGRLRAKTGTLLGVSALSGVVDTPTQGPVAFSMIVNGLNGPASTAWEMQDRIGMALAGQTDLGSLARRNEKAVPGVRDEPGGGAP
jgi:D-alanyl-D-alanine carboxypeptidase/D-alanyl-D-alanine-endopeptidase (penicillin-binding protein 4)